MSENEKMQKVYQQMVEALRAQGLHFKEDEESLTIYSQMSGDDLDMPYILTIDSEREMITFLSPFNFKICEEKRMDCSIAINVVNYHMALGCFDFNISDGEIRFRLAQTLHDIEDLGPEFFIRILAVAISTVDNYNDVFLMMNKGYLSLEQFIEKENSDE